MLTLYPISILALGSAIVSSRALIWGCVLESTVAKFPNLFGITLRWKEVNPVHIPYTLSKIEECRAKDYCICTNNFKEKYWMGKYYICSKIKWFIFWWLNAITVCVVDWIVVFESAHQKPNRAKNANNNFPQKWKEIVYWKSPSSKTASMLFL